MKIRLNGTYEAYVHHTQKEILIYGQGGVSIHIGDHLLPRTHMTGIEIMSYKLRGYEIRAFADHLIK